MNFEILLFLIFLLSELSANDEAWAEFCVCSLELLYDHYVLYIDSILILNPKIGK